jgi:hypothetical protein
MTLDIEVEQKDIQDKGSRTCDRVRMKDLGTQKLV